MSVGTLNIICESREAKNPKNPSELQVVKREDG